MKKVTDFANYLKLFFTTYLAGVRNLSKNTIMAYRDTFRLLLLFCQNVCGIKPEKLIIKMLESKLVIQYLDWLQTERKSSVSTRNMRLAAIHAFFRYLQAQEPEYLFICQKILLIPFKKCTKTVIQHLTPEQTTLLLKQPNMKTKNGRRDVTLLSVLYDTGARVQEICDLRVRNVRLEHPALITLTGKGNKARHVPLVGNTVNLLKIYMLANGMFQNGKQDMPLFFNQRHAALTRKGISYILQKYVAKLKDMDIPQKVSPHKLRHSKALHMLKAGVNLLLIRDILGHSSIQTTEIYAKVDMETKRKSLESVYSDITPEKLPDWNQDDNLMDFLQNL
ncbi:MAG: site-specific integrase [Oscillospiraceae bacterium]|nr:site-specific integrase [Oscillospiraceae bacterium]